MWSPLPRIVESSVIIIGHGVGIEIVLCNLSDGSLFFLLPNADDVVSRSIHSGIESRAADLAFVSVVGLPCFFADCDGEIL